MTGAGQQAASVDLVARLNSFSTPTIANALEAIGQDPAAGFSDASIGLLTSSDSVFLGWAITATMASARPPLPSGARVAIEDYWHYVASHPGPSIVVVQDLDPSPVGAMYGEVQGRLHRSLGVTGIITNGAVRDLAELSRIGFPAIGGRVSVSHSHAHFREIDVPVLIGGLEVRPGDLIHADRHGFQRIPASVDLERLARAASQIEGVESELFDVIEVTGNLDAFVSVWRNTQTQRPAGDNSRDVV